MIQFDQMLRFHSETRGSCHPSCQDHTKTCDTLKRRADLTQRALFGEMYNAVWGSAPYFNAGEDVGTREKQTMNCQVENGGCKRLANPLVNM